MTTLTRWNPLREFDDFFRVGVAQPVARETPNWVPAVDIVETEDQFVLHLDIPAVPVDKVTVSVEDGVLKVSGEREFTLAEGATPQRRERRFGEFSRSFQLPDTVDEDAIEAAAKDGVLSLTIAKRAQVQPRQIEVKVH